MSEAANSSPAPVGWRESLERSKAQNAAGQTVPLLPILDRLRASAEHLEAEMGIPLTRRSRTVSVIALTPEASAHLDEFERYYIEQQRPQVVRNLSHFLAEASLVILNAPRRGLPALPARVATRPPGEKTEIAASRKLTFAPAKQVKNAIAG